MVSLEMLATLGHVVKMERRSVLNPNKDISLLLYLLEDKNMTKVCRSLEVFFFACVSRTCSLLYIYKCASFNVSVCLFRVIQAYLGGQVPKAQRVMTDQR